MGSYQEAVLRLYWAGEDFLHLNNEKHRVNINKLLIFVYRYVRSYLVNKHVLLRGCLSKSHPLNVVSKIILPETLATERFYQG